MIPRIALGQGSFMGVVVRIDLAAPGPPWPLALWNHKTQAWEPVGGAALLGSSPLVLPGDPPEFVVTHDGDVIGVPGL